MARTMLMAGLALISVAVLAGCAGPQPPLAQFGANSTAGYPPLKVSFTDLSQGEIETWEWDFNGDGTSDSIKQNPMHTFANPGNYTVSLTVTGPGGTATAAKQGCVQVTPCAPMAEFAADPISMRGKNPIQFTDQSTCDVIEWEWDFESDGIVDSTDQNPQFIYRKNGVYSVTLKVRTPYCEDTLTKHDYVTITGCSG
jgi:PKD repeat protein